MKEFLKENKLLLVAYLIFLVLVPIKDVGIPHVIGKLIESLRKKEMNYTYMYILLGCVLFVQVGQALNDVIEMKVFPLFQKFLCTKILNYIFSTCSSNLQEILNGKVLSIMAHGPRTMYNYLDVWRVDIIPQIIVFAITFIYLTTINKILGLLFLVIVIIYYIITFLTLGMCSETARIRENYLIQINEQVDDVLMNVVGIINAEQTDNEMQDLGKQYDIYKLYGEKSLMCTMKFKFILIPVMLVSLLLFIYLGYIYVLQNKIKLEQYIVAVMIYFYVFNTIIRTIDDIRDTAIRGGMVKEHLKLFESMDQAVASQTPITGSHKEKYIVFDNVGFNYKEKVIMKNFNLEIKKGEKVLIIGQIGSGKTTILKMLMRYNNPSSGHIYLEGLPLDTIPRQQLRRRIGYIPQNPILLNRTLYENITYGNPNVSKEQVIQVIQLLEIGHIFGVEKLDQLVGKHGSKLSGGQRQVVWILRVLLQNPEILVMDEPTSSIDKETKSFIDRLFEIVMKNRTVIVVSHDEYMSKFSDKVIKMPTSS